MVRLEPRGEPARRVERSRIGATVARVPKGGVGTAVVGLAVLGVLLASCGRPTAPLSAQMRQWVSSSGFQGIQAAIRADAAQIRTERLQGHVRQAGLDCVALGTDASKVEGQLPTPSRALSDQLNSAYVNLIHYANPCATDSGRVTTAEARVETRGLAQLVVADKELSDLLAGRRLPQVRSTIPALPRPAQKVADGRGT